MLAHINIGAILSIHVVDQMKSTDWEWRDAQPESKNGWFGLRKLLAKPEGFYRSWGDSYSSHYTPEEILNSYSHQTTQYRVDLTEKKVFRKPVVKIISLGGKYPEETTVFFETYSEAVAYAENLAEEIPHITIKKG
jgi:hypothetical protein